MLNEAHITATCVSIRNVVVYETWFRNNSNERIDLLFDLWTQRKSGRIEHDFNVFNVLPVIFLCHCCHRSDIRRLTIRLPCPSRKRMSTFSFCHCRPAPRIKACIPSSRCRRPKHHMRTACSSPVLMTTRNRRQARYQVRSTTSPKQVQSAGTW